MRPAPAIEALAGLTFNGVAFAAGMAMFDFGPKTPKLLRYGPRKGETISLGSHGLHVQCPWRMMRGSSVLADSDEALVPGVVEPVVGSLVESVAAVDGALMIRLGDFSLEVSPDGYDGEQWRLLTQDPKQDHLVFGGDYDAAG